MTRATRRLLFYSAVAAFIGISYIAILYAQGYKYNFDENKFFKTGAFYVKINTDASIYVDDIAAGQTSFLSNSFSEDGLLPGQYTIRISKDNYSTWQKNITIEEGLVTDFSRVLILPETGEEKDKVVAEIEQIFAEIASSSLPPSPSLSATPLKTPAPTKTPSKSLSLSPSISSTPDIEKEPFYLQNKNLYQRTQSGDNQIAVNVKGFILSENRKKVVWWTANELWAMWLDSVDYQPYMQKGDREFLASFTSAIKKAAWFRGGDHVVVMVGTNDYQIVELDTRDGVNKIILTF